MASVRLWADQIEKIRRSGNGAAVVKCAVKRYRRGELVIENFPERPKSEFQLQVFPLWKGFDGIGGALLRRILDAHFATPRPALDRNIARLDREIDAMFRQLPAYTIEDERKCN